MIKIGLNMFILCDFIFYLINGENMLDLIGNIREEKNFFIIVIENKIWELRRMCRICINLIEFF